MNKQDVFDQAQRDLNFGIVEWILRGRVENPVSVVEKALLPLIECLTGDTDLKKHLTIRVEIRPDDKMEIELQAHSEEAETVVVFFGMGKGRAC